ncbi:hypothetical protein PSU4_35730 [Pseudonocardia sulfidoxydans NBRC 16205]|uniref:RNA polymerase sigma-70 region 2 domain-containing protein n=1 Tax=Pseudonocardia sulfidoxydans NBRC 16205 TaxID=1223511 RepID=A0A511DII6_9PSEU|nr:hypothetical protein PSU4_35730 [Pseudonocardia sulfidoxydans NBRC 16205]
MLGVGYRITGSLADAEDAVQEAWLRFAAQDTDVIDEPRAWLTTVVGRLCLDRLRSAAVRRERYVGPWLPEPLVTAPGDDDPLAVIVRDKGGLATSWSPVVVNGELGVRTDAVGRAPASVVVLSITNGRIRGVFQVVNPDKL